MVEPTAHAAPAGPSAHDEHPGGGEHHSALGTFRLVFGALCGLTAISLLAANFLHHVPAACWAIMMAVSCAKAMLVITFFMHLLWEASWKYVLTIPASLMSVLLVLLLIPDIGRRTRTYSEERRRFAAEQLLDHDATHAASPGGGHAERGPAH